MQQELPDNVIWLVDGDDSRHVHKYERQAYALGEVATFYDFNPGGELDYDTAVTCRVERDPLLGEIARLV